MIRSSDLLRRARKIVESDRSAPSDDTAGVLAETFAAVIAATRAEADPGDVAEALGACFTVVRFYWPEERAELERRFARGQTRAHQECLDEEGIASA